jgi:hypothetical protein
MNEILPKVVIEIEGGIVQQIVYCDADGEMEFYVKDRDNASIGGKLIEQVAGERVSFFEIEKTIKESQDEEY